MVPAWQHLLASRHIHVLSLSPFLLHVALRVGLSPPCALDLPVLWQGGQEGETALYPWSGKMVIMATHSSLTHSLPPEAHKNCFEQKAKQDNVEWGNEGARRELENQTKGGGLFEY